MIQLIYLSDLAGRDESVLADILASAVRHNTASGITGMLLYAGGNFLQVIEGEEDAVHETYKRIIVFVIIQPAHHCFCNYSACPSLFL